MIKTNIKATSIKLDPITLEYLTKKIASFEKFIDPKDESVMCDVEIGKVTRHHRSGEVYMCELNLHIAGKYLRVESEGESLTAAIDEAKDEMIETLTREHGKKLSLFRRGAARIKNILRRSEE